MGSATRRSQQPFDGASSSRPISATSSMLRSSLCNNGLVAIFPCTFFLFDFCNMSLVALGFLKQEPCCKLFWIVFPSDICNMNLAAFSLPQQQPCCGTFLDRCFFSFNLCNRSFVAKSLLQLVAKSFLAAGRRARPWMGRRVRLPGDGGVEVRSRLRRLRRCYPDLRGGCQRSAYLSGRPLLIRAHASRCSYVGFTHLLL